MLVRYKHFSILETSVIYGRKKFYNTGRWCQSYISCFSVIEAK